MTLLQIKELEARLERRDTRIAELESELAAIGAGGVSGPLMGSAADHFPDATKMVGCWYMVNKDGMATLCAGQADAEQGAIDAQALWPHTGPHRAVQLFEADGRASLSANAGGEPVAEVVPCHTPSGKRVALRSEAQGLPIGTKLYTHPSPTEGMAGWQPIETAPKDGTPLLLRSKKGRIADGAWITATSSCGGWTWAYVNLEPIEWQPLPVEPSMDGESNG